MGYFSQEDIENVRLSTDIVHLVGEYVRLEKRGKNYVGNCPFHQEKAPSFTVTPDKQIFYCFGCHAGGNVFKFLMLSENLTFPEAVTRLAGRAGIALPDTRDPGLAKRAALEERAWKVNAMARDFYQQRLYGQAGAPAREYLEKRGLGADIISHFGIGYAPGDWGALMGHMESLKVHGAEMAALGLASIAEKGNYYDRFRHRIMFPVSTAQGRVVGFGGRVLDDSLPKYLNTPETPYFNKGHLLFALDLARPGIREKGQAFLMEGYLDVITAHSFGITNAVASLGTSLTADQAKLIVRYTTEVVLAYDSDEAGKKAALRAVDVLQQAGCRVKVLTMAGAKDPDQFLRQQGREGWLGALKGLETMLEYKLRIAQAGTGDNNIILNQVLPSLAGMLTEADLEEGVKTVAARLNLSWETVRAELRSFKLNQRKNWPKSDKIAKNKHNIIESKFSEAQYSNAVLSENQGSLAQPAGSQPSGVNIQTVGSGPAGAMQRSGSRPPGVRQAVGACIKAEMAIIQLVADDPNRAAVVFDCLGDNFWQQESHRQIFNALCLGRGGPNLPAVVLNQLDEGDSALLARLMVERIPGDNQDNILADMIKTVRRHQVARKRKELLLELSMAEKLGDRQREISILKEIQQLE